MRDWIFTSAPDHFDMKRALVPGDTLDWPMFGRFKFEPGDGVLIYMSNPVSQLVGRLEIEEVGLPFSEVNPRNDLRKWPKRQSRIPWLRMRVLQNAPIPFKPLQRGSLYYHTEFKPSPYPKLLHEGEREYVLRAFDEAMIYQRESHMFPDGLNPVAVHRVDGGERLQRLIEEVQGKGVDRIEYDREHSRIDIEVAGATISCAGIVRANWSFERADHVVSGLRLTLEDTYLQLHLDGADFEVLAEKMSVN